MPSIWSIKKIKNKYYLYHEGKYVAPLEKLVELWCGGRDLNPGLPAWGAGVLVQARRPPLKCLFFYFFLKVSLLLFLKANRELIMEC